MENNWGKEKLVDICDVFTDGNWIESKDQSPEGIRLIQTGNIGNGIFKNKAEKARHISEKTFNKLKCTEIFGGDCLISRLPDPVGRSCIIPSMNEKMITAVDCSIVRFDSNKILSAYFNYYSQSNTYLADIERLTSGTTRKRISRKNLGLIEIPIPSFSEQKRIVKILDEVFEKIDKAKGNAEKNLQNSRELLESYLQRVFEDKREEREEKKLGDKKLLKIIDGDRGKNYPKKSDFSEDGYCLFLNTKNVRPDGFDFERKMFITREKDNVLRNGKLQRNDIIMTTRGTIGNVGIYNSEVNHDNIRINSGMLIFRPNIDLIIPEYLFIVFHSSIIKSQIKKYTSGAAQPQLPIKTLVNFAIPVPKSLSRQKAIVKKLDALSAETKKLEDNYQKEIEDLEELRKSVLQKAFRGEL